MKQRAWVLLSSSGKCSVCSSRQFTGSSALFFVGLVLFLLILVSTCSFLLLCCEIQCFYKNPESYQALLNWWNTKFQISLPQVDSYLNNCSYNPLDPYISSLVTDEGLRGVLYRFLVLLFLWLPTSGSFVLISRDSSESKLYPLTSQTNKILALCLKLVHCSTLWA